MALLAVSGCAAGGAKVEGKIARICFQPIGNAPASLSNPMRSEVERRGKVIRKTGATVD